MNELEFNTDLLRFLDASPTPFHASSNLAEMFKRAGFAQLDETDSWSLSRPGKYFLLRGGSSIVAFTLSDRSPLETGFTMIGAHTDSPCLKLKPNAAFKAHGYWQLGVEVYGGVLLNPWFDRDLSLAGRVSLCNAEGAIEHRLVDFKHAVATVPSLAIHLDREANEKREINKQTYLPPVVCVADGDATFDLSAEILARLSAAGASVEKAEVMSFDLSLYGCEKAALIGLREEFIAGARLDNLLSCYVAAKTLTAQDPSDNRLIVCNDHEEVGSGSAVGARGPFLRSVLERLCPGGESLTRTMAQSLLVSTDNAHGVHPNFADRHDKEHLPLLNGGPAIKVNSNQAYASTSETVAAFSHACRHAEVPVQQFVSRADMGCGSTIGPLTATALGVPTVDVGVPTFAMHSIRELAGSADPLHLYRALSALFEIRD